MFTSIYSRLIGTLPNTYAYSKGLSEHLVSSFSDQMPIGIARPSIGEPLSYSVLITPSPPQPFSQQTQLGCLPAGRSFSRLLYNIRKKHGSTG